MGRRNPPSRNRLTGKHLDARCLEISNRMHDPHGPDRYQLAREYNVHPITIMRWRNHGDRLLMPDIADRDTWRRDLTTILVRHIDACDSEGDRANLVKLIDRTAKLLGLDYSDKIEEARLALEARQAQAVVAALEAGLDALGLSVEQQQHARAVVAAELEAAS